VVRAWYLNIVFFGIIAAAVVFGALVILGEVIS
jgi:hypothetical protein